MSSIRRLTALSGALLAMLASTVWASQPISGTHTLASDGRVRVETIAGTVVVRGGSSSGVSVTGTIGEGLKFEISGSDRNVLIKVEWPERRWGHRHVHDEDCQLEVQLPSSASLEVEGVSASVEVSGVEGEVDLQTVSGSVDVAGNPGRLKVEAVSGDLMLDVGTKRVSLEVVSGNVRAKTGGGEFEVDSVSGDVVLEGDAFDSVDIESVSGDVEITGGLAKSGQLEVSDHSGDVEISFRGELSAEIEVSTFSGSIETDLGGSSRRADKYAPGEEYHQTVGGGSGRVSIDAFSGTVRLRKI